jgi:hypothetical protein
LLAIELGCHEFKRILPIYPLAHSPRFCLANRRTDAPRLTRLAKNPELMTAINQINNNDNRPTNNRPTSNRPTSNRPTSNRLSKDGSSKDRSRKNIRRRRSAVTAVLDTAELVKVNCSDNSSKKRFWLYRFARAFAVVIGLLLLAALPLSVTVLLLAALPLVLAALDPDNAH